MVYNCDIITNYKRIVKNNERKILNVNGPVLVGQTGSLLKVFSERKFKQILQVQMSKNINSQSFVEDKACGTDSGMLQVEKCYPFLVFCF